MRGGGPRRAGAASCSRRLSRPCAPSRPRRRPDVRRRGPGSPQTAGFSHGRGGGGRNRPSCLSSPNASAAGGFRFLLLALLSRAVRGIRGRDRRIQGGRGEGRRQRGLELAGIHQLGQPVQHRRRRRGPLPGPRADPAAVRRQHLLIPAAATATQTSDGSAFRLPRGLRVSVSCPSSASRKDTGSGAIPVQDREVRSQVRISGPYLYRDHRIRNRRHARFRKARQRGHCHFSPLSTVSSPPGMPPHLPLSCDAAHDNVFG